MSHSARLEPKVHSVFSRHPEYCSAALALAGLGIARGKQYGCHLNISDERSYVLEAVELSRVEGE